MNSSYNTGNFIKIYKTKVIKNTTVLKTKISPRSSGTFTPIYPTKKSLAPEDIHSVLDNISYHLKFTAATTPIAFSSEQAYYATASSVQERLIERWDATYVHFENTFPKETNYISMEFLMGRSLSNALRNIGMVASYRKALEILGPKLEVLEELEQDPGLGNGGLGRLASCFLDSLATHDYPSWGYGIRYRYGLFKQEIRQDGQQFEIPDSWLDRTNPWEIKREENRYRIRTNGKMQNGRWSQTADFEVMAYDVPVPGYATNNCISLRLWDVQTLSEDFDLLSFNLGKYDISTKKQQRAQRICAVLYPADCCYEGKELRVTQQFVLCSATVQVMKHY
jgi:starch phosphorylase